MPYGDLTEAEQAHWNEYTNLRGISDWPGFDDAQDKRRQDSRNWLTQQRAFIKSCAEGKETPEYQSGWNVNKRQQRYDFLSDGNLNSGVPKHEVTLPCTGGATDTEKVYIEEREVYLAFASTTDAQKARKQANVDWLVSRRKDVYRLIQSSSDSENKANSRSDRYSDLCIATHYGDAYKQWDETHNKWGKAYTDKPSSGDGSRSWCAKHAAEYLGVAENPPNSNRGNPQPDGWENRVYGGSGVPWCACFSTCMVWDAGIPGASSAAVSVIMDMAKKGQGMFRGWTTDPSKVHTADMVVIGCSTCHVGLVVDPPYGTIEGNTSPGSEGSQYNGGCVARKTRSRSEIVGWALTRFPD
jgi:hypothetical protein